MLHDRTVAPQDWNPSVRGKPAWLFFWSKSEYGFRPYWHFPILQCHRGIENFDVKARPRTSHISFQRRMRWNTPNTDPDRSAMTFFWSKSEYGFRPYWHFPILRCHRGIENFDVKNIFSAPIGVWSASSCFPLKSVTWCPRTEFEISNPTVAPYDWNSSVREPSARWRYGFRISIRASKAWLWKISKSHVYPCIQNGDKQGLDARI